MMSRPTTPKNTNSPTEESVDSETTKVGKPIEDNAVKPDQGKPGGPDEQISKVELVLLLASVFLSMFLVFVDRTIISTVRVHPIE